jgi:hypothetical protein
MSAARWIRLLCVLGLVVSSASSTTTHAQVFRPRGAKNGPAPKATVQPPAPTVTPAVAKKGAPAPTGPAATAPAATAPAAAASKKPTRATGTTPRRVVTTTPAKKPRGTAKSRAGAEDVVVVDDEEEDVKITDD